MELDKLAVVVRPRTPWEAIDLGFTLARRWFLPLWLLWLALAIPVYLLSALLLPEHPFWVIIIVWWCKPMYEPLLLFWLSRALFGDRIGVRAVLHQAWRIVWPQLFSNLSWRRFNPGRSFNMPVTVLEGLRGKARRERIAVLGRGQHAGTWLTLVGIHFELALEISAILLIITMLPEQLRWLDLDNFLINPGLLGQWLQHIGSILAMSLIAPFYVAAGFSLYLARRTELEAWDIEIAFRRLVNRQPARQSLAPRLRGLLPLLLAGGLYLMCAPADLMAATEDRVAAKNSIEAVLADKDFGREKEITYWHYTGDREPASGEPSNLGWLVDWLLEVLQGFGRGTAALGKGFLLIAGGVLVGWLVYKALLNRRLLSGRPPGFLERRKKPPSPVALFGLELDGEPLPEDIAASCARLCQEGQLRAALSLLYRGALIALLQQGRLELADSATEGECLAQVRGNCSEPLADYFGRLTRLWIQLAYAHRLPPESEVMALGKAWPERFGGEANDAH